MTPKSKEWIEAKIEEAVAGRTINGQPIRLISNPKTADEQLIGIIACYWPDEFREQPQAAAAISASGLKTMSDSDLENTIKRRAMTAIAMLEDLYRERRGMSSAVMAK